MDIDKLAKLSCLNITEHDRKFFEDSLSDVFIIMDNISTLENIELEDNLTQKTVFNSFVSRETTNDFIKQDETKLNKNIKYVGIHLENGVFLSPKVIKKD